MSFLVVDPAYAKDYQKRPFDWQIMWGIAAEAAILVAMGDIIVQSRFSGSIRDIQNGASADQHVQVQICRSRAYKNGVHEF